MALHQNNFNFLRLLGAALVIVSHCYYVTGQDDLEPVNIFFNGKAEASAFGLCIFFFISGYLVNKSAYDSSTTSQFLRKRIFRIYPALIILVLLTVFVLGPLATSLNTGEYFSNNDSWQYLSTMSGIRIRSNLPGVFTEKGYFLTSVNSSLWTIMVELALYFSLTIFLMLNVLKNKKLFTYLSLLIFSLCLITVCLKTGLDFIYVRYLNLTGLFYLGCFVFSSGINNKQLILSFLVTLIIYAILTVSKFTFIKPDFLLFTLAGIGAFFVGTSKFFIIQIKHDISYGVYIFAFPIQQIVFKMLNFNPSIWLNLLLTFIITIPIAFLSWRFIEKPSIEFNRKKLAM